MNKTIYYHNQILLFTHKIMIPRKHAYISYQIRYLGTLKGVEKNDILQFRNELTGRMLFSVLKEQNDFNI